MKRVLPDFVVFSPMAEIPVFFSLFSSSNQTTTLSQSLGLISPLTSCSPSRDLCVSLLGQVCGETNRECEMGKVVCECGTKRENGREKRREEKRKRNRELLS